MVGSVNDLVHMVDSVNDLVQYGWQCERDGSV